MEETFTLRVPTGRQWIAGLILFSAYFCASVFGTHAFTPPAVISATAGIGLAGLVLEGAVLWPALYLAALAAYLFDHAGSVQLFVLILLPAAQMAQAVVGATLLKKFGFDPMLNHIRDGLMMFLVGIGVSSITPAVGLLAYSANQYFFHTQIPAVTWGSWWAGVIASTVVIAPFLIRWLYHPFFHRTRAEVREIAIVFGVLLAISITLFFTPVTQIGDISLIYFLLVPLFWIAIRLGPRLMTLAIALIGVMSIWGTFWGTAASPTLAGGQILQVEMLIITLAGIFLILAGSEEERKEALKNLRSHVAKLEDEFGMLSFRDRTKSEFLATLAHELRNPLAPMVSSLELLRLQGLVSTENLPILDDMDDRIRTIRRLLDDILDISRISQKKFHLQKEYIELQKIITRAVHSVEKNLEMRGQTISVNVRKEPIRLNVDAVRIEQVVTNLLNNASKFSEARGHISISVQQLGGVAEIRIKDDGVGIDPTMLNQIFEPFQQIEGGRKNDGLGIGLSLAKQLVEMHDGTIEARSKGQGHGSEFFARLPIIAPPAPQEHPSRDIFSRPLAKIKTAHRVLVVDDNTAAAQGVGKLLKLMGYTVDYAYSGREAVQQASRTHPDSVILDIGLPDMNGYEAADLIRGEGKFSGTLIALTGYGQDEDKQKAYAAGFDHHLTKPIGIADLQRVLNTPREEA